LNSAEFSSNLLAVCVSRFYLDLRLRGVNLHLASPIEIVDLCVHYKTVTCYS